ncbi:MAG: hypothetical protein LBB86_00665 [Oscillospiraceae bacterium]|nr:hypothetical protein [Oscillospiraceae bacterium]
MDVNTTETYIRPGDDIKGLYGTGVTLHWSVKAMGAGGVSGPTASGSWTAP